MDLSSDLQKCFEDTIHNINIVLVHIKELIIKYLIEKLNNLLITLFNFYLNELIKHFIVTSRWR